MPSVDIDIDDFLSDCDKYDIKELIKALTEDGHIPPIKEEKEIKVSYPESVYQNALNKLMDKWNRLSKEDEEIILKIANKF
jgi:hypothetical protein